MSTDVSAGPAGKTEAAPTDATARIVAAWAANDADAFADAFIEDGSMVLPGDVCLKSREEIRTYMTTAYAGPYQGTRVTGKPLKAGFLGADVAVVVTEGGVLLPGETEVSGEQAIRATWVLAKRDGEWLIGAYHNSPINVEAA